MARKLMQRNFATTTVSYSIVEVENGQVSAKEQTPVQLAGKLSKEKAQSTLSRREELKGLNVVVTDVKHETHLYTMPVEKFLELADKSEATEEA